jgi:uncharacterized SAM-binding protein YcdF (DUF218 family)
MTTASATIPSDVRADVETLWDYQNIQHELHPCDVGIGLGSHDLGVARVATELYHQGMYPWLVFTGANAPTTIDRFQRGEAIHYRDHAVEHGVPAERVLVETEARNTGENITRSRTLLVERNIPARSVVLMSRPYQKRRAYATAKKLWPEVEVLCAAHPQTLDDYVAGIGDVTKVIDMLVGDTQRIDLYAERGFAIAQDIPDSVRSAYERLVDAGYISRLVT